MYPPQGSGRVIIQSGGGGGITKHTELLEKEVGGVIDHANDSITTAKIRDGAITNAKLADDSVSTSKIQNNAITTEKIANGSITTEKFNENAIAPNSDKLDGYDTSTTPLPNRIPVSNALGKLAIGWLPDYFADVLSGFPPKPPAYNDYVVPYALAGTAGTTLALTASRIYWIPIVILYRVRITGVAINVATSSAGTHWVGIYDSNEFGHPRNLIIQWSFDSGTTGIKTSTTGLPIVLEAGIYWIAWASGSGATVRAIALASCRSLGLPALGTANISCWYTSGTTLPATAPTSGYIALTGSALPAVGFQYEFVP